MAGSTGVHYSLRNLLISSDSLVKTLRVPHDPARCHLIYQQSISTCVHMPVSPNAAYPSPIGKVVLIRIPLEYKFSNNYQVQESLIFFFHSSFFCVENIYIHTRTYRDLKFILHRFFWDPKVYKHMLLCRILLFPETFFFLAFYCRMLIIMQFLFFWEGCN